MDKLTELVANAFADDATMLSFDFRAEIRMLKKLVPLDYSVPLDRTMK